MHLHFHLIGGIKLEKNYMSEQYYTLKIAGLERQLKRFSVSDTLDIAAFILFGDVELTEACAKELLKKP